MSSSTVSRAAISGTASGVIFMAFFGTMWAGIGVGGLQDWGAFWLVPLSLLIGLILLIGGLTLKKASRNLPHAREKSDIHRSKRIGLGFNITFAAEFLFIAAAGAICGAIDHFNLFFPIMALIVGAHFLPLAYLFQVKFYYVTGILLCLLGIATFSAVPEKITLNNHEIITWWAITGFGAALILWITGAIIWRMGRKSLKEPKV